MAEEPDQNHSSIEAQALKETIDEGEPPRDPKLSSQTMLNTVDINKIPVDGDTQESIVSHEATESVQKQEAQERQRSHLDSQKSYRDLVTGDIHGSSNNGKRPAIQIPSASHVDSSSSNPGTQTVISNMRGRSIIAGSKDLVVNVNGSTQERNYEVVPNSGTEQSTHRISNDKLGSLDPKNETVLNSMPQTPSMQPGEGIQGVQSHGLHKDSLNKDIQSGINFSQSQQRQSFDRDNSYNASAQGNYKEQAVQLRSNNSLHQSYTTMNAHVGGPKQSRQQQMYQSIISNAVQKSALDAGNRQNKVSVQSAGGGMRRSGTTGSTAAYDGKVNVGLSTSSSMRSHEQMPHLVPQKTNVLTGATTKYFSNQTTLWRQDYSELMHFQKLKQKHELEVAQLRQSQYVQSKFASAAAKTDQMGQTAQSSTRGGKRKFNPLTGMLVEEPAPKVSMPLRGKGVNITNQLQEMHERRDRLEMMNYQQKMVNQQQSIKMLMEEDKFVAEVNNAAKLSAEIALRQKESRKQRNSSKEPNSSFNVYSNFDSQSHDTSIMLDQKRTEPLITKAYQAFRHSKNVDGQNLLTTEAYLDEQQNQSFRDTTMSGLRHAQRLMDSTQVQTGEAEAEQSGFISLPNIQGPKLSIPQGPMNMDQVQLGEPVSEQELVSHIQRMQEMSSYNDGNKSQLKAMNRLGLLVNGTRPSQIRQAAVIDINRNTSLPANQHRRKNKNDFYRLLLSTNRGGVQENKINNDVFIPRSILKKSYVPGSIKEQRLEAAAEEFFEYQLTMQQMKRDSSEGYLGKYEVVFGQHLETNDPQLSPKLKQLVQDKLEIEQIFDAPDDSPKNELNMQSEPQPVPQNTGDAGLPKQESQDLQPVAKPEAHHTETEPAVDLPKNGEAGENARGEVSSAHPSESEGTRTRKIKIRQAIKDKGVFETGVDVVEHEMELEEDEDGRVQALRLYNDGKLTHKQMKEILMRQLKQEKIFGFSSYDEFQSQYFKKDLVAVEDLNRLQVLKQARRKYEMRWNSSGRTAKFNEAQRRRRMQQQQQAYYPVQELHSRDQVAPETPAEPYDQLSDNMNQLKTGIGLNSNQQSSQKIVVAPQGTVEPPPQDLNADIVDKDHASTVPPETAIPPLTVSANADGELPKTMTGALTIDGQQPTQETQAEAKA